MDQWIGCNVSVNCGSPLGHYQGSILQADGATITLTKAFRNGFPYPEPHLTINASDIKDLKIIEPKRDNENSKTHSTIAITKSSKKNRTAAFDNLHSNAGSASKYNNNANFAFQQSPGSYQSNPGNSFKQNSFSQNVGNSFQQNAGSSFHPVQVTKSQPSTSNTGFGASSKAGSGNQSSVGARSKPIDIQKQNKPYSGVGILGATPNRKDKQRRRNEAFAGAPVSEDPAMQQEFDFEKNLALFDKRAIWDELNHSQKPDLLRQTDFCGPDSKFRHDENVLTSAPAVYRAIHVPEDKRGSLEYVTDEGVVVPSVTARLRQQLWNALEDLGLHTHTPTLLARSATDIALRLLGGSRRLDPRNAHQVPTVVILVGAHKDGQVGVLTARALASHGVNTVVHVSGPEPYVALLAHLNQYQLSGPPHRVARSLNDLPSADLIVTALADHGEDVIDYQGAAEWSSRSRATVLSLDPPAPGTHGVVTKVSVLAALPLAHSPNNGKLYLANINIPTLVYSELGIKYKSPFGAKNVVALHPSDI